VPPKPIVDRYSSDEEDIIIELMRIATPKAVRVKKEKDAKGKGRSLKVPKRKAVRARRQAKSPPPAVDNEDLGRDLFGSISEEEALLADPNPKPDGGPEPIEVDPVEIELHPSVAEQLIADADRVIFNNPPQLD